MQRMLLIAACLLSTAALCAQELKVAVNRKAIALSDVLSYEVSLVNVEGEITLPNFEHFRVVKGPTIGYEHSTFGNQITSVYKETYLLRPLRPGTFMLPAAKAQIPGKTLASNRVEIEVVQNSADADKRNSAGDFMAQISTNKTTVYVGEPLVASYQVFAAYRTRRYQFDWQDTDGFYTEELETDNQLTVKNIGGRNLETAEAKRQLLFPQRSGEVRIEPFTALAEKVIRSGFRARYEPVSATSRAKLITVRPLPPGKPSDFVGTFLDYDITMVASKRDLQANEAIDVTVTISGKGNLNLVTAPDIDWPSDFEVYDPKQVDRINITRYSESGKRRFEYVVIPRSAGSFEVPGLSHSWFNPDTEQYEKATTSPLRFEVVPGSGNATGPTFSNSPITQTEVETLNQDIRHIRNDAGGWSGSGPFLGSVPFWGATALPLFAAAAFVLVYRRRGEALEDTAANRQKRAAKVARKYLKQAEAAVGANKDSFYDALSRSLFGYLADKWSIPLSEFNRETLAELLSARVSPQETQTVLDLVDRCQEARFSPVATLSQRDALEQTAAVIQTLEHA